MYYQTPPMRLVTFTVGSTPQRTGALIEGDRKVLDLQAAYGRVYHGASPLLHSMLHIIDAGEAALDTISQLLKAASPAVSFNREEVKLLAPIPVPPQMRDFLCFEQHLRQAFEAVAKLRGTPGAIGYTELNIAAGSAVRIASIKNAAGEFVKPLARSIAAAATASGSKMNNDFRISLTNAPGKESYPISSFTWFYVPAVAKDPGRGSSVASYLKWVYTSGQKIAQEKGYATLPPEVLEKVIAKAASVR